MNDATSLTQLVEVKKAVVGSAYEGSEDKIAAEDEARAEVEGKEKDSGSVLKGFDPEAAQKPLRYGGTHAHTEKHIQIHHARTHACTHTFMVNYIISDSFILMSDSISLLPEGLNAIVAYAGGSDRRPWAQLLQKDVRLHASDTHA